MHFTNRSDLWCPISKFPIVNWPCSKVRKLHCRRHFWYKPPNLSAVEISDMTLLDYNSVMNINYVPFVHDTSGCTRFTKITSSNHPCCLSENFGSKFLSPCAICLHAEVTLLSNGCGVDRTCVKVLFMSVIQTVCFRKSHIGKVFQKRSIFTFLELFCKRFHVLLLLRLTVELPT